MDAFKASIKVELDLRPPANGESRETVLSRCREGAGGIVFLVRALRERLQKHPDLQKEIDVFLREMKGFFGPELPGRFGEALEEWREWQREFGKPAA